MWQCNLFFKSPALCGEFNWIWMVAANWAADTVTVRALLAVDTPVMGSMRSPVMAPLGRSRRAFVTVVVRVAATPAAVISVVKASAPFEFTAIGRVYHFSL
jgi:hypothetical protein